MTQAERQAARVRLETLTDEPWRVTTAYDGHPIIVGQDGVQIGALPRHREAMAPFFVHAPVDLRLALDALDALEYKEVES